METKTEASETKEIIGELIAGGVELGAGVEPVVQLVERLTALERVRVNDPSNDIIIIPDGKQVIDLKPFVDARLTQPLRKSGTSKHTTLASIIDHVLRHKGASSVLFAKDDPAKPSLLAVYDYNEAGDGAPRFGSHRALYDFPLSEEWQAWIAVSRADCWLTQTDLAEFLETRLVDVVDPGRVPDDSAKLATKLGMQLASQAALLGVSRGLSLKVNRTVSQVQNLSTGEVELSFAEEHAGKGGGQVVVPSAFAIGIPVFTGDGSFVILARLRYRVGNNGAVSWAIRLHRADASLRQAFGEAIEKAHDRTKLPLFFGAPE